MTARTWKHYPPCTSGQLVRMPIFALWSGVQARPPLVEAMRAVPMELIDTDGDRWTTRIPCAPDSLPHPFSECSTVGIFVPPWTEAPRLITGLVYDYEPDPDGPPPWQPGQNVRVERPWLLRVQVMRW